MAPTTQMQTRLDDEKRALHPGEYDTPRKTQLFHDYDREVGSKLLSAIYHEAGVRSPTARRWLRQRKQLGQDVYRKTRKRSNILGRKSKISKKICKHLVSTENPVRDQTLECNIEFHHLPVKRRALTTRLKKNTKNGRRYKIRYVRKRISDKNRREKVTYAQEHQHKTMDRFWQFVYFTDKFHINPSSISAGFVLREEGIAENSENIQERPKKEGNKLHVAGWVNWNKKCKQLKFYHDEEDATVQPKRPRKPRRKKQDLDEEWDIQIKA